MDRNNCEQTKENNPRASKEAYRTSEIQSSITHRNMSSVLVIFIFRGINFSERNNEFKIVPIGLVRRDREVIFQELNGRKDK